MSHWFLFCVILISQVYNWVAIWRALSIKWFKSYDFVNICQKHGGMIQNAFTLDNRAQYIFTDYKSLHLIIRHCNNKQNEKLFYQKSFYSDKRVPYNFANVLIKSQQYLICLYVYDIVMVQWNGLLSQQVVDYLVLVLSMRDIPELIRMFDQELPCMRNSSIEIKWNNNISTGCRLTSHGNNYDRFPYIDYYNLIKSQKYILCFYEYKIIKLKWNGILFYQQINDLLYTKVILMTCCCYTIRTSNICLSNICRIHACKPNICLQEFLSMCQRYRCIYALRSLRWKTTN